MFLSTTHTASLSYISGLRSFSYRRGSNLSHCSRGLLLDPVEGVGSPPSLPPLPTPRRPMSSSGGPSKGRRRQERPPPGMQRHGWKRYVRAAGLSLAAAYILTTTRVLRMQRETDGHGGGRTAPTTAGRPFVKVPSGSASSSDWSWSSSSSSALRRHEDRGVAIVDGTGAGSHLPPDRAVATSLMAAPLLLQAKLDRIVSETGGAYQGTALWELSDLLPGWMREYMEWHGTERRILTRDSWRSGRHRVVVLDCPRGGVGGDGRHSLAECFTAIPYLLRECHAAGRLLFLHWTGPTSLAEFLVPPIGGLDWRLPKWLEREMMVRKLNCVSARGGARCRCKRVSHIAHVFCRSLPPFTQ